MLPLQSAIQLPLSTSAESLPSKSLAESPERYQMKRRQRAQDGPRVYAALYVGRLRLAGLGASRRLAAFAGATHRGGCG